MILKKVRLENIRSYLSQDINFPEGSLLLSGDVGSGKSTILLSIEFALFGLRRGQGSSLLRNGEYNGNVELHFSIDDKDIIVKRTLKRDNNVSQDSGYIIINGIKKEGTATELKNEVLKLLNYPKELLTKQNMIYDYTVYTPQEQMKVILLGDKEIRLDTLRKVFDIDKYKRIRENSKVIINEMKGKKKEFLIMIQDLDEKKKEREENNNKLKNIEEGLKLILPKVESKNKEVEGKKLKIKEIEEKKSKLEKIKRELEVNKTNLENRERQINLLKEELKKLEEELKEEIREENNKEIKKRQEEIKIENLEEEIKEINNKLQAYKIKQENSRELINKIESLSLCPVCKQEVGEDHKHSISNEESKKIEDSKSKILEIYKELEERELRLRKLKEEKEFLNKKLNEIELNNLRFRNYKEKKKLKIRKDEELTDLNKEIDELKNKQLELNKNLDGYKDIEEEYKEERNFLERLQEELKQEEIKKSNLNLELRNYKERLERLGKEIKDREVKKGYFNRVSKIQEWMENYFVNIMQLMEKQVMLRVHADFNSLFEKWFNILVEDDINVRLDEEFTPLIMQNNHDIDYLHLSGGEKTAAALAYRLALNQVINNLMSNVKTNDLLILDEPTDGFSSEQLDKMKLVLDELNIKQIIIVSHEAKIESFVDNIIRFKKENHISYVV